MSAPDCLVIGIDLGGTKTQGVLYAVRPAGCGQDDVLASVTRPTRRGGKGVIATITQVAAELLAARGMRTDELAAIGIGVPGVVSAACGTVSHGVNIGIDQDDLPLAAMVTARLGVPAVMVNDVTAAMLGAAHALGVGDDVALLSIGTGLAAGLLLDGKPRVGARGNVGEIGHLVYRAGGLPCACGQRGCLELYASGSAVARMWPQTSDGSPAVALLDAAAGGVPEAIEARDEWLGALAHAVTVLGLTVDVGTIFLAGGVTRLGDRLLAGLQNELDRRARSSAFLQQIDLASRLVIVDPHLQVGTLGAALSAFTRSGLT
ncbi:ROK family protein [Propionimicrobium sp. PCR01-08-3]|uniref:ROK family protein n=1 Tax=Propionimicrobium sp. PCR01-08-3 TaxID=3052086 RepID=UPI00255CC57E|nr:ROK family protein [Propionimicrobium sp. PCR01-08-3]WIY82380.1 ROK family protein [Propionimicrobium sp. PCR01-08-3]